jgi:DNA gyrase subunit A
MNKLFGGVKVGIKNIKADEFIRDNMMDYGSYVILQRAIPRFEDGLKPVHRRILYAMWLDKATKFTKSANIEGVVMKLHPHGSTYSTIVNMAQLDRQATLLVNGKGNFGQATSRDLAPAAARYTEVKLSDASIEMMKDLNKNLVDFIPNYDGQIMMPDILPVKFPLILTQASSGVAYGMASSIPSFNLKELSKAMIKFIKEGKKTLLVPDFATKGMIVNDKEIFKKINLEGSGSVQLRGKAEVDGLNVYVTEFPFSTTREAILDKIIKLSKTNLKEVAEIKDLTGFKGTKIRVRFKRGTDMKVALEKLYQLTPLQSSYSTNLNVLINGSPKVMSVWGLIDKWIEWRRSVIVRGLEFDIAKMRKELHFLKGLEKVLLDIDKAIEIIRRSKASEIEPTLMKEFDIDEVQAKAIADMKLRNINKDYIIDRIKSIQELENEINDLKDIVSSLDRLNEIIIKDLEESAKKYGVERQTKLVEISSEKIRAVKKQLNEVPDYPVRVFVTEQGYIKKFSSKPELSDQYLKPGDKIVNTFDTSNHAEILIFGTDSACYKIKLSEIDESTNKGLGVYAGSGIDIPGIVGSSILDSNYSFVIIAYDNNRIAKIALSSFKGNRKKLANSLSKTDKVVGMLTYKDEGKFIFKTTASTFKIPTSKFDAKERWTKGVYGPRKGQVTEIRMAD